MTKPKKPHAMTEWWTLVGKAEGAQIYSDFEDPQGRDFSFLYTKGMVYLYPKCGDQLYSLSMSEIGKGSGMGGFDTIRKLAGISEDSIAYQWLAGCLRGAQGF